MWNSFQNATANKTSSNFPKKYEQETDLLPGWTLYTIWYWRLHFVKALALSDQIEQMKTTAVHLVTNMIVFDDEQFTQRTLTVDVSVGIDDLNNLWCFLSLHCWNFWHTQGGGN